MRLRDYECAEEAFTEVEFNEVLKQKTIDANTTGQKSAKPAADQKEDIFSGLMMNMAAEDQFAEKQKRLEEKKAKMQGIIDNKEMMMPF
jgi:hypothetical protein